METELPSEWSQWSAPEVPAGPVLSVGDRWVRATSHGIDEVVLSLGYRPDAFTDAYPDATCAGVRLHYAVEPEPLDTAGAIRFAALDAGLLRSRIAAHYAREREETRRLPI